MENEAPNPPPVDELDLDVRITESPDTPDAPATIGDTSTTYYSCSTATCPCP